MSAKTAIEWTDATWNPVTGCSVVSPGCANCYAMRLAGTRLQHHPSRAGLTTPSKAGPVWNGQVRFNEGWLDQPLRWRRPRRIFVCAHGDLFHESVPDAWIDRVFAIMALAPQHTFQVLTKRAARMRAYMVDRSRLGRLLDVLVPHPTGTRPLGQLVDIVDAFGGLGLPNVWLGVSAEDQARLDDRWRDLAETPARVRFLSLEPLIGPIDLTRALWVGEEGGFEYAWSPRHFFDWVIVGGESGPGARPMRPDWARGIRGQCAAAGVAFFFKQWGDWVSVSEVEGRGGEDFYQWPEGDTVRRTGKKRAGRRLDGVEHSAMPVAS